VFWVQKGKKQLMKRWKFLRTGKKSEHGNLKWKLGEWKEHGDGLKLCESGFHCSKGIYRAFSYVQGEILAEVEVKGKYLAETDKEVWSKMRLIKCYKWTKTDNVLFSIYAARLVLNIFEKACPNDRRPREAIEAAETYIKSPTKKNRDAAYAAADAAHAAYAAYAAADAAIYKKLDAWMLKHVKELKEIK